MSIMELKQTVPCLPKLNQIDEIPDPMIVAHYTVERTVGSDRTTKKMEWWILAGQTITYRTVEGGTFEDFHCFGIAKIFEMEMGEFDLLSEIRYLGGDLDKNWKPIKLSEFKWD